MEIPGARRARPPFSKSFAASQLHPSTRLFTFLPELPLPAKRDDVGCVMPVRGFSLAA
jgi:hypothetical protein